MSPSQHAVLALGLALVSIVACGQQQQGPLTRPAPETVSDGYGDRPKDQAGGVQSATYDAGKGPQFGTVEELLKAKFPLVDVRRALFVVDGMAVAQGRGLAWLAPADVMRIDLLTNPADRAIYGLRGGNGVVVITTRRKR